MKSIGPRNLNAIVNLKTRHQVSSWDEEGFVQFGEQFTRLRNDKGLEKLIIYMRGEKIKKKTYLIFFLSVVKK